MTPFVQKIRKPNGVINAGEMCLLPEGGDFVAVRSVVADWGLSSYR
jgi:hypothetical protein